VQDVEPTSNVQVGPINPFLQVLAQPRFLARLLSTLGLLVIALTIVGVFSVVHHEVGRRLQEFGIRVLLGASPRRLRLQVVAGVLIPAAAGVTMGLAISWPYMATLETLLFGVEPHSPVALLATGLFVLLLVICGSWLLARQASRAQAARILRAE
jgi:putative ABC transport system permease protein